ncbi:MAG: hypothetical protein R6V19_15715 [Armatimonadota bacterium]
MPLEDKQTRRLAEREVAKHNIDYSLMTIRVINKVCYLGGRVSRLRGAMGKGVDVEKAMENIVEALESMKGIDDVVNDARVVS